MDFLSSKNSNFSTSPKKPIWAAGKNGKWADKELSKWAGGLLGKLADGRASCSLSSQLLSPLIPSYPLLSYPVSLLSPLPHLQSQVVPSECIPYSSNLSLSSLSPHIMVIILYHPLPSLIIPLPHHVCFNPRLLSPFYHCLLSFSIIPYHPYHPLLFFVIRYHPLSSLIAPCPIIIVLIFVRGTERSVPRGDEGE